jgi:hypothetical protein
MCKQLKFECPSCGGSRLMATYVSRKNVFIAGMKTGSGNEVDMEFGEEHDEEEEFDEYRCFDCKACFSEYLLLREDLEKLKCNQGG